MNLRKRHRGASAEVHTSAMNDIMFFLLLFCSLDGYSQWKTYIIGAKGDTLNAVDRKDLRQGKWVIHYDQVRGEPGYEEEGIFKNDKKEGVWRVYNLNGDLIAVEFYKLGGKHGIQQYYTYLGELYREESWLGYDPDSPYDTIPVYGQGNNEIVDYKIVKAEQYSVKHGDWKYFWSDFPASTPLAVMVEYAHRRHWVEQYHEEAKTELGWDQYQGRRWEGFHRHAITVMLSYSFLVWLEARARDYRSGRGRPRAAFSPPPRPAALALTRGPSAGERVAAARGHLRTHRPGAHSSLLFSQTPTLTK